MKPIPKRKPPPKVLADELTRAFVALRNCGLRSDQIVDLLAGFRRGELRHTSSPSLGPADGLTPQGNATPLAHVLAIQRLDEVWRLWHQYRQPGGAKGYLSPAVEEEAFLKRQQELAKRSKRGPDRGDSSDYKAIGDALKARDYWNLPWGNKGRVVAALAGRFRVSVRTVNKIAALYAPKRRH